MEIIRDILADVNVWSPGQTDPCLTYLLPVDGPKVGMGAAFWLIKLILANLSIFVTPALQLLRLRQAVPHVTDNDTGTVVGEQLTTDRGRI